MCLYVNVCVVSINTVERIENILKDTLCSQSTPNAPPTFILNNNSITLIFFLNKWDHLPSSRSEILLVNVPSYLLVCLYKCYHRDSPQLYPAALYIRTTSPPSINTDPTHHTVISTAKMTLFAPSYSQRRTDCSLGSEAKRRCGQFQLSRANTGGTQEVLMRAPVGSITY